MSYRDTVLFAAYEQLAPPVRWKTHEDRILEYFQISTGNIYTKKSAMEISWCSYFVHWCVFMAGVSPLPQVGTPGTLGKPGSVGRFMKGKGGVYDAYNVAANQYTPQPGDMYYKPVPSNHIGFISDVQEAGSGTYEIKSIDGNSGPKGWSPHFDMEYGKKIGYGFIYQPDAWRKLTGDCWYIALPDD